MIEGNVRSCWPRPSSTFILLCSTSSIGFATSVVTNTTRSVQLFKAARLCNPKFVRDTHPDFAPVDRLRLILLLDDDGTMCGLKKELPEYVVAAQDFEDGTAQPDWWWHQDHLPCWRKATSIILLISPSSAGVEHVFYCLKQACLATRLGLSKTALSSPWCCSTTQTHVSETDTCTKPPSGFDICMAWPLMNLFSWRFSKQWVIHNSVTCCRLASISVLPFSSWVKCGYANLNYSRKIKNNDALSFVTVNFDHNGPFEIATLCV